MNWGARRQEIADVLTSVPGVQGKIYRPNTPVKGDAWPRLGSMTRDESSPAFYVNWSVFVFLPQNEQGADQWIDQNLEALIDALEEGDMGYVESAAPADIGVSASQYGLLITMRGE